MLGNGLVSTVLWLTYLLLTVCSRKQKIEDRQRPTGFARLYQMLRTLQAEIEDAMPDFEEQMVILTYVSLCIATECSF